MNIFDHLDEPLPSPVKPKVEPVRYACVACAGTGRYQGVRLHQQATECFVCRGRGWTKVSPQTRQKRHENKLNKIKEAWDSLDKYEPGLKLYVSKASDWSQFALQIVTGMNEGHAPTPRQMEALARMKNRPRTTTPTPHIDLSPIRNMFERARASGYKAPTYRAEGLVINRAPDHGNNPGALYIKSDEGEYLGKIVGIEYMAVRSAPSTTVSRLESIATNPREAAIRWGQRTGRCSCCGRELTNHTSIELGIGPICAEKWGL